MDVRPATIDDAAAISMIYAPYVTETAISFETEPPSAATIEARMVTFPWFVATDGDVVVGYAYAHPFAERAAYRWSVETSVYVDRAAHGRGVGRALYAALLDTLEERGLRQAFAGIALPNPASVGLHEAMGFTHVGTYRAVGWKFDRWHDVGWWQRPLGAGDTMRP